MIFAFGSLVYWKSKRISAITKSSWESEYVALSKGASQIIWLRAFLGQLGFEIPSVAAWSDKQGAIASVRSGELHHRSKHIDVAYKYARDLYREGVIDLGWVSTRAMPVDLLTTFERLRPRGGLEGPVSARAAPVAPALVNSIVSRVDAQVE